MSHRIRREVQQLTNVEERKWPATIIRREPAICIEVKFLFDLAGRTMKPAQILRGLLEDSGRQILLIRPGCVIFDSVHAILIWFVISSSIFRRPIFQKISEFLRESPRSSFFLAVIVLPAGLDLSGRIEAEQ